MSKPLTTIQREKMFKCWAESQHIKNVSTTCGVSEQACRKYRKLDKWDSRLKIVNAKTAELVEDDVAKDTARKLKVLKNVENVYLTCLIGHTKCEKCGAKVPVPKLKPNFKDITEIYRYDDLLRGKPDSRPDLGRSLDKMSDDDLIAMYERACADVAGKLYELKAMVRGKAALAHIDEIIKDVIGEPKHL